MPAQKLTKRLIDDVDPSERDKIIWDSEVPGLGLKVTPTGRKTFTLYYRTLDGTQRKPKVGEYGAVTLDQARSIARDMLAEVRAGRDPSATRKNAREGATMNEACDRFIEEHAEKKKLNTLKQYRALIDRHVRPSLGNRKIAGIEQADVARLIYAVGRKTPISANRLRAVLSKLFHYAEKWQMRPNASNPVTHIERNRENKRHRDLTEAELVRLGAVLSEAEAGDKPELALNPRAIAALRVLMFTGCRRNEILHLRWSEVDLERGLLRLRDSKTGAKLVPLNGAAIAVLQAQTRVADNPHVFASERRHAKGKPIADAKRAWTTIRKRAGLDGDEAMRIHDLRHNFASVGAGAGLSLPLIGKLLGHATPQTTARYAMLADSPARMATEEVGRRLTSALTATPESTARQL
jgi:integrase